MRKKFHFLNAVLAVMLLTTACGSSAKTESAEAPMAMAVTEEAAVTEDIIADEVFEKESAEEELTANTEISETAQVNRKLIRTFNLTIETKEFDEVIEGVQKKVQELGGYIEHSSLDGGSAYYKSYNRYSHLTVRIPSDKLDGFISNVKETANVTYISESTEDITLKYVDVESRKIAMETERDRLLELLEKAETVEDIITIESRLSEVRYQLESYTSQLRTYDNQVDYSTVYIEIYEVEREIKVEPKTFWDEVKEEFEDSLYDIGRSIRRFGIRFLGATPYLLIWAIVITAFVVGVRRIFKKRRIKKTPLPEDEVKK